MFYYHGVQIRASSWHFWNSPTSIHNLSTERRINLVENPQNHDLRKDNKNGSSFSIYIDLAAGQHNFFIILALYSWSPLSTGNGSFNHNFWQNQSLNNDKFQLCTSVSIQWTTYPISNWLALVFLKIICNKPKGVRACY